jgi:sulfofructose kinase
MDIVGIENGCVDFNIQLNKIPATNGFAELADISMQGGGNVSTGMAAAARLGAKCAMIGVAGLDAFGQFIVEDFERHGIDTSHIRRNSSADMSLVIVLAETSTAGRSMIGKKRMNQSIAIAPEELDRGFITQAKVLHMGRVGPAQVQAATWAREAGMTVLDDAGYYNPSTDENTGLIDAFVGSEHYYKGLFTDGNYHENCRKLQQRGPRTVIFTFGADGLVGLDGDEYFELPAFKGYKIIDTCGAGDVFHGAYAFGLIQGWPTKQIARFASAVSFIKCTCLGGRAGIPDFGTVMKFLETGEIDYTEIDKRVEFYREGFLKGQ